MIISMQGNWTVSVKSKSAAFEQRFVVSGAASGNGSHPGTPGTTVAVTGSQWSIAIQNNPGTGFQLSDTMLKFPHKVGGNIEFEIRSDDAAGDRDFNDLVLTCSTPDSINSFIVYGNLSLYSGRCIFNPCRRGPYVIETPSALRDALKNPRLRDLITQLYPERIPPINVPNPPDPPPYFKPLVLDVFGEATQPRTAQVFKRLASSQSKAKGVAAAAEFAQANFELVRTAQLSSLAQAASSVVSANIASIVEGIALGCTVEPAPNITLSFEEYDRTTAEKAGGAYTGTGPRRVLGDTITDMNGNYIFRFDFDMTVPGLEDAADIAPGEDVNVIIYPDVILKVTGFSPYNVLYESAPYYNIPNLKRIDLCLPESTVHVSSVCFNGNLIGSLGNVFLGGNQNTAASTSPAALRRYGDGNFLEANGKISVGSALALFGVECAAWGGVIDMRGCLYDAAKTAAHNTIKWYTIRIRRAGTTAWQFVSQNYKHPRYSKRNLPNYIGDDVGPFSTNLHVDGGPLTQAPAYKNIQREIFVDGIDWEFSNFDRYMQLNTTLYDAVAGVTTPGTFHVRVDGYDAAGNPVANATDMIALFIHNLPLGFGLGGPSFSDPAIVNTGCGLYRLTDAQLNTPMQLSFKANDPYGFVDSYTLNMGRCPAPMLALQVNQPKPPLADTPSGASVLAQGNASANTHNSCPGYSGTLADFANGGLVAVEIQPAAAEGGWIKSGEYFTVLSFSLTAYKRVTNGYNTGLSGPYYASSSIYMERLSP
jgi:hypothetical protein